MSERRTSRGPSPEYHAVIPLRLGSNNVFALPDERGAMLIDAGPDFEGAWEVLVEALTAHGLAVADVHTVVLTHSHLDHAGLAARWQAAGARILVGRADAAALAQDAAAREHERALARAELLRHGVPPEQLMFRWHEGERYTHWPAPLRMTPLTADAALDDGDAIDVAGRALRVVGCPGHTPGTILLLDEAAGTLFTGDHVLPRMAATVGIQFQGERRRPSLPAFLASLHATRRLSTLCRTAYPGHGEPITDPAEAVDWTVRFLEQRARRTLRELRCAPGTAYEVATRVFAHLGPRHVRPVMAETLGLLDLLAERGLARTEQSGPYVIWREVLRKS